MVDFVVSWFDIDETILGVRFPTTSELTCVQESKDCPLVGACTSRSLPTGTSSYIIFC